MFHLSFGVASCGICPHMLVPLATSTIWDVGSNLLSSVVSSKIQATSFSWFTKSLPWVLRGWQTCLLAWAPHAPGRVPAPPLREPCAPATGARCRAPPHQALRLAWETLGPVQCCSKRCFLLSHDLLRWRTSKLSNQKYFAQSP